MKKPEKQKLLFLYKSFDPFIKKDYEILQKYFTIKSIKWQGKRSLFQIAKHMMTCDLSLSWFASDHAAIAVFFTKIFRKKSIVIVGGFEVAEVPEINYGRFMVGWHKRMLTKFALNQSDIVLPVSQFTKNELIKKANPKCCEILYNSVDTNHLKPRGKKENIVVTIGNKIQLKGLDTFAKVSRYFPEYTFVIIGINSEKLRKINPDLIQTGHIPHDKVIDWLQKAKIYCQLSYRESFGMGIAEAMSCGCTPVTTDKGAIPEVVGDTGFYVPYGVERATVEAIQKAIHVHDDINVRAKDRIVNKYSIIKREKELLDIIDYVYK